MMDPITVREPRGNVLGGRMSIAVDTLSTNYCVE